VTLSAVGLVVTVWVTDAGPRLWRTLFPPPPVRLSVSFDNGVYNDGWVLDIPDRARAAAGVTTARGCNSLLGAAREAGGADIGTTFLRLFAEGRTTATVVIVDMRARIAHRDAPVGGALVSCAGGGEVSPIRVTFNLDAENPEAQRESSTHVARPYFGGKYITLSRGEFVPFSISGVTKSHYVTWKLEVRVMIDGRRRTYVLDDDGRPFRTTAPTSARAYYPAYQWRWDRRPPRLVKMSHPPPAQLAPRLP
jgi:hypothetical protein